MNRYLENNKNNKNNKLVGDSLKSIWFADERV